MAGERRRVFAAIVGSGFSGIAVARELKRMGIEDFVILERASALGGTWRDNRYPGCACDIPSHLYSFSFAPNREWTRTYSPQPEIRAYMERIADELDVRDHVLFDRELVRARFDESAARWELEMRSGERLTADVLVMGVGALSNPAIPALPGVERFRGAQFHSASWDERYDLRDKRVAVIGTGASAIQFVPQIQPQVSKLHLVQRTAPWILPKDDRVFGGLERALFRRAPGLRWLYRQSIYWRHESALFAFTDHPRLMKFVEREGKKHLARAVRDPALRALLTPTYRPGCKRILLSNDYYPALAQPNVEVSGEGVTEVREHAMVLSSGRAIDVDAIIYGTGFRVHDYLGRIEILGRSGESLGARFDRDGARAFLGTMVAGFPNLFVMTGPNTGLGHNSMIVMIEGQARYARDAIRTMRERGARTIEPKPEAEAAFNRWIGARTGNTVWASGCKSWYLDEQGRNTTLWPGFASTFRARLARFDDADLELGSAPPRPGVRDRAEVRLARALARLPDPVKRGLAGGKPIRIDGDTLLPEIQLTLAVRAKIGAPDYRALGVERARRQFRRDTILHRGELEEVALVRSLEVDGAAGALEARLFSPAEDVVLPLLVYFHGGGFTLGDLDSHEPVCRLLAARGDMHVLSVAYRLAPEHRFPAAVDDACAAYRWAAENARALGSDPALVGVGGDSAGANLSAVLSLAMRDASGPRPALQLLVYPPTDRVQKWPSLDRLAQGFLLTSSEIAWFNEQYIPDADRSDPRISPLRATDHANLPPALVVTAAFDPLRDEGEAYAARLREAGTPVTLRRIAGQVHGFVNLVGVSESSRRTVIEIARDTREMFDRVARRPDVAARESLAAGG